jgi:hypothetical protein
VVFRKGLLHLSHLRRILTHDKDQRTFMHGWFNAPGQRSEPIHTAYRLIPE